MIIITTVHAKKVHQYEDGRMKKKQSVDRYNSSSQDTEETGGSSS
jgi:hypothetical protein